MLNYFKQGRLARTLGALMLVGVLGAGCQDLNVENLLEPDRERAAANPSDVLSLIGGGFWPNWFRPVHGVDGGLSGTAVSLYMLISADMTGTLSGPTSAQWIVESREPRPPLENSPVICSTICQWAPRDFWGRLGTAMSIPFDGLQLIDGGMTFTEGGVDITPRARAFAKLVQGLAWGYSALTYDQTNIVPETIDLNAVSIPELNISSLTDYPEAAAAAVASLEEAIQIAQQHPTVVHFPSVEQEPNVPWFGSPEPISNEKFIQLANTLAARILVLNARTPQEREQVDWQRVLNFTANGLQSDFLFQLQSNRTSNILARVQSTSGSNVIRWDYRTIGMADQSGNYQAWHNASLDERTRFDITTPDRRITGSTTDPHTNGTYTCYRANDVGFEAGRGLYSYSAYQWARHKLKEGLACAAAGLSSNAGTHAIASADENRLYRAEALLRTGQTQAAVDLINVTRTREHMGQSLPPLTVNGVPTDGNGHCVPRMDNGQCGTVWTALRYERMIELAAMDLIRGWADSRGFGMLVDDTFVQTPIPGNILQLYGLPNYTYGGPGDPTAAVYNPTN